ncbi:hypothetical protein [Halorarius halobius]|uniref:hypothetical protein n=1 Tax=Halorarius halobius TaxID=2962671 RepID=UPI0020CE49CF|nr:hypothetical protein [Halorarius halobius]
MSDAGDPGDGERTAGDEDPAATPATERTETTEMNDTDMSEYTDPAAAAGDAPAGSPDIEPISDPDRGLSLFGYDLSTALQGGALAVALLFALVAAVGFYASAQRVIDVWVAAPYRPVFTMGFNLAVLLAMVGVVTALTRRLSR